MRKPSRGGAYHWGEYHIKELLPAATGGDPIVLLLGCGDAGEKPLLAEAGYQPIGMDVRRSDGVDVLADAHVLPFADASIDLVLSMQVFEHLKAPWLASREVSRVLRPRGWFVGSVAFLKPYHGSYFHMTHEGIRQLLLQAGLETDKLFAAQSLTYSLYGGMIPIASRRARRWALGSIDRLLFGTRTLAWQYSRRKSPDEPWSRSEDGYPLSFRSFDRLCRAPAVVFRARKSSDSRT